ncbi:MAG: hypothetical protein HYW77_00375 [Parcubacteria group bacterium]|nr:hypothetical protein [Parcubacteria group bacterium]
MMVYADMKNRNCKYCKADFVSQGVNFQKMAIEESRGNYSKKLKKFIRGFFFFVAMGLILVYRDELAHNWKIWVLFFVFLAFPERMLDKLARYVAKLQYPDSLNV